jgi:rubrerythrin
VRYLTKSSSHKSVKRPEVCGKAVGTDSGHEHSRFVQSRMASTATVASEYRYPDAQCPSCSAEDEWEAVKRPGDFSWESSELTLTTFKCKKCNFEHSVQDYQVHSLRGYVYEKPVKERRTKWLESHPESKELYEIGGDSKYEKAPEQCSVCKRKGADLFFYGYNLVERNFGRDHEYTDWWCRVCGAHYFYYDTAM